MKPCPFCGSKDITTFPEEFNFWYAWCTDCGAKGPIEYEEAKSKESWDDRQAAELESEDSLSWLE